MTAVTVAVSLVVLMGMAALAVDGSNLYRERGDVQNAADTAVLAAAYEYCLSGDENAGITAGEAQAAANGYDGTDPNVTVQIVRDPDAEDPDVWVADIETTIGGFFSVILGADTLTTGATAKGKCTVSSGGSLPLIFAGGTCSSLTFDQSGNDNIFNGDLHSNADIKWEGENNTANGDVTYVTSLQLPDPGKHTFNNGLPSQVPWKPWPITLDPADFEINGPVYNAIGSGNYYPYFGDKDMDAGDPDGVHVIFGSGKFTISGNGLNKNWTLVTINATESDTLQIEVGGSNNTITAYPIPGFPQVLFYSDYYKGGQQYPYTPPPYSDPPECGNVAIKYSGNQSQMTGLIYAARGMIEFSGNENTQNVGLAAYNVKFNGNENVINALSGGSGGGAPSTVLLE